MLKIEVFNFIREVFIEHNIVGISSAEIFTCTMEISTSSRTNEFNHRFINYIIRAGTRW